MLYRNAKLLMFAITAMTFMGISRCWADTGTHFESSDNLLPMLPTAEPAGIDWSEAFVSQFSQQDESSRLPIRLAASRSSGSGGGSGGGGGAGKQSQNPIADLATLPIQSNWNFGVGPDKRTQFVALVQPVIPLKISDRWNLITRPIMPLINSPIGTISNEHGLGDLQWQNFFVPVPDRPGKWTWGVGPSFVLPTASDPTLGLQRWGAGVSAVAVYNNGPVVGGALLNQNYIESGVSKPFLIQPFFNYNFDHGILNKFFFAASGEFQADWEKGADERWLNVFGIGPGKIMNVMGQPMTVSMRFAPYLAAPAGGPSWQFRFQMNLLFPK